MPFQIVRNDITKMPVDAIVNAAKPSLLGGGGVDGAIHAAAGPELLEECRTLGGCKTGQAKITRGYKLPARYVIHTVGPVWNGGFSGESEALASCYRNSLLLAEEYGCESVAFPLISAGIYGYPKDKALRVASDTIAEFLREHDMTVYLVLFSRSSLRLGQELADDIREYIDDHYVREHSEPLYQRRRWDNAMPFSVAAGMIHADLTDDDRTEAPFGVSCDDATIVEHAPSPTVHAPAPTVHAAASVHPGLDDVLRSMDESFQQMLFRKIDERGLTDAACYKKANVDRKLFSKIRGDVHYRPSKPTAIAFAIALELDMEETQDLLKKAGYALSDSSCFDVIIKFFIERRNYNVFEINEALFAYDQVLLGA